jgi:hypothetical protein
MEVAKACLSLRNPREIDGRAAAIAASGFAIIRSPLILLQRATIILHGVEVLRRPFPFHGVRPESLSLEVFLLEF